MSSSAYVNSNFKAIILNVVKYLYINGDGWVRGMNGTNELFFNKKKDDFSFEISFKFNKDKTVSFQLVRTQWSYSVTNGLSERDFVSNKDLFSGKCELNYKVLCKVVETLYTVQEQNELDGIKILIK